MSWPSITCRDLGRRNCIAYVQLISAQLERPPQSAVTSLDSAGYIISPVTIPQSGDYESRSSPISGLSSASYDSLVSRATFPIPTSLFSSVGDGSAIGVTPFKSQSLRNPPVKTICQICNTAFSGSPGNRKLNYNRHKRSVHHEGLSLECLVPNCGKSFKRSDYLKTHYRNVHNIENSPSDVNEYQAAHDESLDANTDYPSNVSGYRAAHDESLGENTDSQWTFLLP